MDVNVGGWSVRHLKCMTFLLIVRVICQLKPKEYLLLHPFLVWSRPPPGMQHVTLLSLITDTGPTQELGGRKRTDDIWVYFKYNPADNKTECIVTGHGGQCGHKVGEKIRPTLSGT